jgi:hypothetical protein
MAVKKSLKSPTQVLVLILCSSHSRWLEYMIRVYSVNKLAGMDHLLDDKKQLLWLLNRLIIIS